MDKQEKREVEQQMQPVNGLELTHVAGGVGPVFDESKVTGFQLPSWLLPVPSRVSITTIR
ncbi:MAG: hypothetical protein AB7U20_16100 [Planctomycetaceae bacterium]